MTTTPRLVMVAALAFGSSVVAAQPAKPAPDYAPLAEKIVTVSANVKEGEIVEISGGVLDLPLLEEVAIAVRKRGAFPLLTIETDKLAKASNTEVPAKYDSQAPKLGLQLANIVDVYIQIPAVRDPGIPAMLAPDRAAKRAKAGQAVDERRRMHDARIVEIDNGLAPSWTRANSLGVSEAELGRMFWTALDADYSVVEKKCKSLRDKVAAGSELRITHANGTDLKMSLKGRRTFVSDGVTNDADIRAGGPRTQVFLPAGDVYVTPVAGSARGKLVDDRMVYLGKEIRGVTADIARGRVTNIGADAGWDVVKGPYAAAGRGKTEVGFIDLGCNPAIPTAGKLETWMGAGMVTIGIGGNRWAGGANSEPFSLAYQLPGATVTLDGKVIVENGQLK
ncbi:MAG TPA: aminopeptidase [Kofleriaceae bacterium]|nr:aminopeptidase [Kofleriaceae bacterium]